MTSLQPDQILKGVRTMYESMLHSSLGHERTNGTCLYAAILCEALLRKFAALDPLIRGGDGKEDGGLVIDGVPHGHYWVEVEYQGGIHVVDITADQFGLDAMVFAPKDSISAHYVAGDQATVDAHVQDMRNKIKEEYADRKLP